VKKEAYQGRRGRVTGGKITEDGGDQPGCSHYARTTNSTVGRGGVVLCWGVVCCWEYPLDKDGPSARVIRTVGILEKPGWAP